jgi:electron transfer flavoprotein alpha subunit
MANKILVVLEQREGKVRRIALEMLSLAQKLSSGNVAALTFGSQAEETREMLARYGADQVVALNNAVFDQYSSDGFADAVKQVQSAMGSDVLLFPATAWGKDLAPRTAGLLGAGLATDCTAVEIGQDGRLVATRPIYAGKAIATVAIDSPIQMFSLRPNIQPVEETNRAGQLENVDVTVHPDAWRAKVTAIRAQGGETLELTEAEIIVSGGRGMKGPENFKLLEALATELGAAVGSSRPVADEGWVPHSYHIGQTGKVVSPNVYFAIGISGAIQHLAGISGSKYIVAINNDAEAPIFKAANYGIVGNLFEVVPAVTEAVRKLKAEQ